MMNNILVTAIGSMSATMVLKTLAQNENNKVFGTDIYVREWQPNSSLVSEFYQVSKATSNTYIQEILDICVTCNIKYIVPLTDPEVDCFSENRSIFEGKGIIICISTHDTISKCRDKAEIEKIFRNVDNVEVIPSLSLTEIQNDQLYPIIAKPKKGRSSEGLYCLKSKQALSVIDNPDDYVFQPYISGDVFTIDFIRDKAGNSVSVVRKELIRTSNGAGITVDIEKNDYLELAAQIVGDTLKFVGCVNFEFLFDGSKYYLMDINPRFSAGVGFSVTAGYDFISNHLNCFQDKNIDTYISIKEGILSRISYIV